jgi:hypothetical protein
MMQFGDMKARIVRRNTVFRIAAWVALLPAATLSAGDRHRLQFVWERDLHSFIREVPGEPAHTHFVAHLAVSDDEQSVLIDVSTSSPERPHHLLVMPVDLEAHSVEQFEYTPSVFPGKTRLVPFPEGAEENASIPSIPWSASEREWKVAADKGRILCFAVGRGNERVICKDANGTLLTQRIHGGYPLSVAASGTLAAGNDWFSLWKPFTEAGYWVYVRRQVIWDIRTGEIIAEWDPALQKQKEYFDKQNSSPGRFPFLYALSASGQLFFEAGDDKVRLSRINRKP